MAGSANEERKKILLIEDEQELSEIILRMLESFGYEGASAECARDALQAVHQSNFDLLIIDLTLPDANGRELYEKIIEQKPDYRGKAVFTSGMEIPDDLKELIRKDKLDFLQKPFSLTNFRSILQRA